MEDAKILKKRVGIVWKVEVDDREMGVMGLFLTEMISTVKVILGIRRRERGVGVGTGTGTEIGIREKTDGEVGVPDARLNGIGGDMDRAIITNINVICLDF
jgi:hypothetical protein